MEGALVGKKRLVSMTLKNVLWWGVPNLLGRFRLVEWGKAEQVRDSNMLWWGIVRVF
jgi:hypothetical protein